MNISGGADNKTLSFSRTYNKEGKAINVCLGRVVADLEK
jgi:hypothetical protein